MSKILFVINPVSGDISKDDFIEEVKDAFSENDDSLSFYETMGENDLSNLMKRILQDNPDIVVAAGGDGTANLVAQAVMEKDIQMGIIPLGSANGLAAELSIPSETKGAFEVIRKGKSISADMVRIHHEYYSVHLSDVGFNARIVEKFDETSARGLATYAKMFFSEILKPVTHPFQIHSGEQVFKRKAMMLVIANASRFGTGAIINPKGKLNDGIIEIVILKPYKIWHFLRMIIPFYTGKLHRLDFIEVFKGKEFLIVNPHRQSLQVDGEVAGNPPEIEVLVLPSVLNILVPGDYQ